MTKTHIKFPPKPHKIFTMQIQTPNKPHSPMDSDQTETNPVGDIASRWRDLSGSNNWRNMLDPLDEDLRRYILHNGNMAMAAYDAFNMETASKYAGASRYDKNEFFERVGLLRGNPFKYKVTKYVYATSRTTVAPSFMVKSAATDAWLKESNWMGYVAVATDEAKKDLGRRDILISWRGTIQMTEWFEDFDAPLVQAPELFQGARGVRVHRGFLSVYTSTNESSPVSKTSAREQVLSEVTRLINLYKNEEVSITTTGHSLGAALGSLNAVDIVANNVNKVDSKVCPVAAFVFACPHLADRDFKDFASKLDVHILRIKNVRDLVPMEPPTGLGYVDVGEELKVDSNKSDYLRYPGDWYLWHDLEVYLHLVAGTRGMNQEFKLGKVKRDIGLVNKYYNSLKIKYLIPPMWRVDQNKRMVQFPDGTWKLDDRPRYIDEMDEMK